MRFVRWAAPAAVAACLAGRADAGFVKHEDVVELQTTNWDYSLEVPQFDTKGGLRVLKSVCVMLTGTVSGEAGAESLDAVAAKITVFLQAEISLSLAGDDLVVVLPVADDSFNATPFDGAIDFGGTSGVTFSEMKATDEDKATLTPLDKGFASFIGDGTLKLDASAKGESFGSGAGNLILQFATQAGARWSVLYEFNVIPTPGSVALGACAIAWASRRRRA